MVSPTGLVFVLVPALILEWLAEHHKTQLSGLMFTGVSIGLILDSILIDWSSAWFSGQLRRIPIGLVALPWRYLVSGNLRKLHYLLTLQSSFVHHAY